MNEKLSPSSSVGSSIRLSLRHEILSFSVWKSGFWKTCLHATSLLGFKYFILIFINRFDCYETEFGTPWIQWSAKVIISTIHFQRENKFNFKCLPFWSRQSTTTTIPPFQNPNQSELLKSKVTDPAETWTWLRKILWSFYVRTLRCLKWRGESPSTFLLKDDQFCCWLLCDHSAAVDFALLSLQKLFADKSR